MRELGPYLAAIVDWSEDAIIGKDLNGTITAWNRAAERMFGYSAAEAIGQPVSMLAAPNHGDEMPAILAQIRNGQPITGYETVRRRKDGTDIPVLLTVSPIKDAGGRIVGASKIVHDITERKRFEAELHKSHAELELRVRQRTAELEAEVAERTMAEERFRMVVEAAPNAMIMVGCDGRISLVNSQTEKLFGYSREELVGERVERLVPERFRQSHANHRNGFFSAPTARAMGVGRELFGIRKDGSEVPIEMGLTPINCPEGNFVLASVLDITERKISENNLKLSSLDEKLALLAEVHHRVKNNLYIISSLLSMQANALEDEKAIAKLRESERRVMSMALIHEQLYHRDDMSSIDLAEYVRELAAQLFASYATNELITYRLEVVPTNLTIEQSIPCGLMLNELITNALKYAYPNGQGEISIRLRTEQDWVWITVADKGVGVPADFNWKKAKSLGMKIIEILTAQLEGDLEIGSPPGVSFTVRFPKRPLRKMA